MEDIQPKKNNSKLKYFLIAFDCVLLVILIVLLLNRLTLQKRIETLEKYAALPLTGELEYLYYDMPDSVGSTMILDDSITSNDLSSGIIDLSKLSAGMCSQGEILKKIDATTWGCAEDATVKGEGGGEVTGFVPGYGLILSESVLKVNSPICTGTNKLQWNGTAFVCSQDLDTNTQLSEVQVEGYIFDGDNVGTLSSGTLALDSLSFTGTLNDANIAALSSGVQGDILYHNGSNWTQLAAGTSGQFLRTQGAGVNPQWATVSGSISGGTVDDAILHWDSATSAWLENTNYLVDESGNVTSGTWQGTVVTDTYINDALTISSSGTVDWTALNNYPGACAAGNAVTQIGDILVCTAFWDSISDVPLATPSDGDTTHLSNADQIYDWVTGLGYLTTETDPSLATWTGSTNITILGTITTGTWNGTVIGDSYISDALTVNSSGTVDWTALNNYPGACAAGNAVTQIGDTLVCTAFWDSISDVPLATPSDGDTTHLSNADQIYDWVIGLGYLTTETDPTLATWAGSTNITTLGTISTGTWNGSTIGLANGGTGASLSDPNDDRILFWDDTAGVVTWLDIGTNLSITGTILDATDTQLSEGAVEAYIFDGDNAGTLSSGTLALDSLGYTGTLDLANGGLGVSLSDPNDDRILFWDDTAGAVEWLDIGTNLSITGTVLDASTVSVYWEDGTNGIFEDDEGVIVGIDQAETLANTGFVLAAGDLFVQDELGVEGDVFTDSSFIAGSSLTLNDAYIRDSGDLVFQADGDTDDYLYFDTTSNEEYLMFEDASLAYGNDPGIRLNSTSGELEYRDENESVWTSLDSLGASAVPNFYSYQDTTADTHVDNDTTDYWDEAAENGNEHPNITPSATSSEVLVIVTIRVHTPNQDRDLVTNVQRNAGSDPTCAAGNEVGPLIAYGRTRDNTNETFSAVFVDNPATTSTVYYTLCSDSETVDEDSNNTIEEIYFTLYEVNNAADLAEVYATSDTTLGIAEVVSLDPELDAGVKRAEGNYNDDVLGIISTKPALAIGGTDNSGKSGVPVALTGRVPVKVTTSNGAIQPGDFLTTSEIPGVAMKATKSGYVIGKALTGLEEGEGVVLVFVERGYKPFTDRLGIVVGEIDSYMSEVVDDVLVIKGDITAYGSLKIEGHLKVSEDTAGSVTIPEGKTEVSVTYRQSYNDTPKVAVTPQGEIKTFYHVRNKTKDGFKIVINRPQTKDVNFDWIVME